MTQAIVRKKQITGLKSTIDNNCDSKNNLDIDDFNKRCENALTVEQARAKTIEFIKKLPWKK